MKACSTCDKQQTYLTKRLCRKCYYIANRDHILARKAVNKSPAKSEYDKAYYEKNKELLLEKKRAFHLANRDKALLYKKSYYVKNKESVVKANLEYINKRSKIDPMYRLSRNLRSRLHSAIKNNCKSGSAVKDLGCSIDFLKSHLEAQFTENMSWANYGPKGWHIDHIRPLCSFDLSKPEELKVACHYTNLKPLWWLDNLSKGGSNETS